MNNKWILFLFIYALKISQIFYIILIDFNYKYDTVTLFVHSGVLYMVALAGIIYAYYRAFSRNISRRYSENEAYLKVKYKVIGKFNNFKFRMKDRKTHVIFKCPNCSQKIRVPRGKGNISIKCPKCRIEFIKKT